MNLEIAPDHVGPRRGGAGAAGLACEPFEPRLMLAFGFSGQTIDPVGDQPASVLVVDLNADGLADIAAAGASSNEVAVLLTGAGGTPGSPQRLTVGAAPRAMAAGDVDGDGDTDLVAANSLGATLSVLFNDGLGNFTRGADIAVASGPRSVVIGDFDGDGGADLAVALFDSSRVAVLRGTGAGAFAAPAFVPVDDGPVGLAAADLDADADLDLVTVNITGGTVTVLRNGGSGSFSRGSDLTVGSVPRGIAVSDLDGDGDPDLAVSNSFSGTVSVLLNTGAGGFGQQTAYAAGEQPNGIVAGDFDRDGDADIATANLYSNDVMVLANDGAGALGDGQRFGVGAGPVAIAAGDVGADGNTDLVTANALGDTLTLLRNVPPQPNTPPVVGSLAASAGAVALGQAFTLTASGVADADGSVASVRFYRDSNGNGQLDASDEALSPRDENGADGWTWTGAASLSWGPGPSRFFARAFDDDGAGSGAVSAMVVLRAPPAIAFLSLSPRPILPGGAFTLSAQGVSDEDGTVESVRFFRDSNGNGVLDGTDQVLSPDDANGADGFSWTGTADPAWGPGLVRFFARATDDTGLEGNVAQTAAVQTVPPTVSGGAVMPGTFFFGDAVTLLAYNPADADGTVTAVEFYFDADGNGALTGTDPQVAVDTDGADGFSFQGVYPATPGPTGAIRFFARARDNFGVTGAAVALTANIRYRPAVSGLAPSVAEAQSGDSLVLTATAADFDGTVASVAFYRDSNASGGLDGGDELLGTDSSGGDGFSLSLPVPSGWGPAVNRFFAKPTDNQSNPGTIGSTTVLINDRPTLDALAVGPDPAIYFDLVQMSAFGADDPDGTVVGVRFYIDVDGDGLLDPEIDWLVGESTSGIEGGFDFETDIDPLSAPWSAGEVTILAAAFDDFGAQGPAVSQTFTVQATPIIAVLVAQPPYAAPGATFSLEVLSAYDDDGTIVAFHFYRDSDGDGELGKGDELLASLADGVWTGAADPGWGRGVFTFFAVGEDNDGFFGRPATVDVGIGLAPVVSNVSASPSPVSPGEILAVQVTGVSDPDGEVELVVVYRDADGDSVLDPEEMFEPYLTEPYAAGSFRAFITVPAGWAGEQVRLFAVAYNDLGIPSAAVSALATVTDPPILVAITPSTMQPIIGGTLTLAATVGEGGPLSFIRFYRDTDGGGTFDEGDEALAPDATDNGAFSWSGQVAVAWGAGTATFFAVPFGPGGEPGAAVSVSLEIWTALYFPEGWRNDVTVNEYVPLVNPHAFPVSYRILAHYEVGERDQTIAEGVLAPFSRGGVIVTERGRGESALTRLNVGYALEVQSSAPIGAVLSRYDNFSAGGAGDDAATGEAFTSRTSTRWTFVDVARSPGEVFDFLLYYNPGEADGSVTFTLYHESGAVEQFTFGAAAKRRGGVNFNAENLAVGRFTVVAISTVPLVMAQSRYEAATGQGFSALGRPDAGAVSLSIPNVDTRPGASSRLVIFNPHVTLTASVRIIATYHDEPGLSVLTDHEITVLVGPRRPLEVEDGQLGLVPGRRVTLRLESDRPVAAQLLADDGARGDATGAGPHADSATGWLFADAFLDSNTAGEVGFEELAVHNPGGETVSVTIVFYYSDGSAPVEIVREIAPEGSLTVDLHAPGSPALQGQLNFYAVGVFAPSAVVAAFTHWDLFQNGGWSTFGTPIGPPLPG